jgi:hypothetical protein
MLGKVIARSSAPGRQPRAANDLDPPGTGMVQANQIRLLQTLQPVRGKGRARHLASLHHFADGRRISIVIDFELNDPRIRFFKRMFAFARFDFLSPEWGSRDLRGFAKRLEGL